LRHFTALRFGLSGGVAADRFYTKIYGKISIALRFATGVFAKIMPLHDFLTRKAPDMNSAPALRYGSFC
jgi:hypothetical protein